MNVEHENFFLAIFASVHLRRRWFGHQLRHRVGEVGVDHQRVGPVFAAVGSHADGPPAVEQDFLHLFAEREPHAHLPGDAGHPLAHRGAPAERVPDAVLVFEERQDGEQARAVERRHAQVLRLERERQPHARVAEVPAEFARRATSTAAAAGSSFMSCQRSRSRQPRNGRSRHGRNCSSLTRLSSRKRRTFGASAGLIFATSASSFVRSGVQFSSPPPPNTMRYCGSRRTIGTSVCRSRPISVEDAFQNARVEEERRPQVEAEAVSSIAEQRPPTCGMPLDDVNVQPGFREQQRRGQPARPGADDEDGVRAA